MAKHVTHFYEASGWDDDYFAGCHIEIYEKTSRDWGAVTCKHCLRNHAKFQAQVARESAARIAAAHKGE